MRKHKFYISHHLNKKNVSDIKKILELCSPALIVGGAVRNALINIPIKDIDIATGLPPELVSQKCLSAGMGVVNTGIQHGTVTIISNGYGYEVTTLRRDVKTDGRHATVEFIYNDHSKSVDQCLHLFKEDAERRDLTINAMYADLNGNVYDFFNSFEDLQNKLVRFVGDPSRWIKEDYLRILRFFRFSCYYAQNYDLNSLEACIELSDGLKNISSERCTMEIIKILQHTRPWNTIKSMSQILQKIELTVPSDETVSKLEAAERKFNMSSTYAGRLSLFNGIDQLKLSSKVQKSISMLHSLVELSSQHSIIDWIIKSSNPHNFWDGIILKNAYATKNQIDTMLTRNNNFPIKAQDIMTLGIKQGPMIGQIMYRMRVKYILNGDKDALLNELSDLCIQDC